VPAFIDSAGRTFSPSNWTNFSSYVRLAAGLSKNYILNSNVTAAGTWTPIGYNVSPHDEFTGNFNGGGYSISGINFTGDAFAQQRGLFAKVGTGGIVQNLRLSVQGTNGGQVAGSVAGTNRGTIQNCTITINGTLTSNQNVGGVAGDNYGTIQNCYVSDGSIIANTTALNSNVGGIVGTNVGLVQNCYVTSSVTGNEFVGGIAGSNYGGTVRNCVALNSAIITTHATPGLNFGRVAGENPGTLTNNYADQAMPIQGGAAFAGTNAANDRGGANVSAGNGAGQFNNEAFWTGLGWDFTNIWTMSGVLPVLQGQ